MRRTTILTLAVAAVTLFGVNSSAAQKVPALKGDGSGVGTMPHQEDCDNPLCAVDELGFGACWQEEEGRKAPLDPCAQPFVTKRGPWLNVPDGQTATVPGDGMVIDAVWHSYSHSDDMIPNWGPVQADEAVYVNPAAFMPAKRWADSAEEANALDISMEEFMYGIDAFTEARKQGAETIIPTISTTWRSGGTFHTVTTPRKHESKKKWQERHDEAVKKAQKDLPPDGGVGHQSNGAGSRFWDRRFMEFDPNGNYFSANWISARGLESLGGSREKGQSKQEFQQWAIGHGAVSLQYAPRIL